MNKKTVIILIVVILIICFAIGFLAYMKSNHSSTYNETTQTLSTTNNIKTSKSYIETGSKENKGFIVDNVLHSELQGDIHFSSYLPKDYNKDKEYAIYFALPGWEKSK